MKIFIFIGATFLCVVGYVHAEVFVYPVAALESTHEIFVVCQKSINDLELYLVNEQTQESQNILWSLYTPAHVQVLPSEDGFSFIDQGTVYIKKFEKRHPRAVSIMYPLHNINNMQWIDDYNFLYVAQEDNNAYNIFLSSSTGETTRLSYAENIDFLYPQKIDSTLFSIIKNNITQEYAIAQFEIEQQDFIGKNQTNYAILKYLKDPACFLYMLSPHEGFFLTYPKIVVLDGVHDHAYKFICHHISKSENNTWQDEELFSFFILKDFITGSGPMRLYESLERFVPNYMCKGMVLFLSADEFGQTTLYSYSLQNGAIEKKDEESGKSGLNCLSILKRNSCALTGSIKKENLRSGEDFNGVAFFKFKL